MAGPSSNRDRDRSDRHYHRTISSTTLLLILSLVLAVLAVLLSLPNRSSGSPILNPEAPGSGLWGYLTPRRSQVLVARESQVALREAEVARREAELLAGQPGGLTIASCEPCPLCPPLGPPPFQTIVTEVTQVEPIPSAPAPPEPPTWWKEAGIRIEDILDRELRVSDREKDVGRREEQVNRREHDAGRRESWVMEQLMYLNDPREVETEEYVYETPSRKAKPKELPPQPPVQSPPPPGVTYKTTTITRTILPHTPDVIPAQTRVAAPPTPEDFSATADGPPVGRTRKPQQIFEVVEEIVSETPEAEPEIETATVIVRERPGGYNRRWW